MTTFSFAREVRDPSDGEMYWTDGRAAENFLAGIQCGMESRHTFRHRDGVFGACEGFVYFIGTGAPYVSHVKIGFTTGNPNARLQALQTGCPFPLHLLGFILGNRAQEAELHQVFRDYRAVGEWFAFEEYVERIIRDQLEAQVVG